MGHWAQTARGSALLLSVVVACAPALLRGQTATVSTTAQLRAAVNNSSITTININPGTYLLTSSGSGQLQIERNLTITNTGGGRVVIDANNASRVFYVNGATVTMTGLTITRGNGNSGSEGAGIYANSATLRLIRSTLSGNATSGSKPGGGIWANSSTFELINSTVSGNTASGSQGGGIYANGGSMLVTNSTIAGNSSSSGGGLYRGGATLTLRNSIVADNTGGQIAGTGTITSNGFNVVEGGCTGCSGSDITADPALGALADNGGDSYTRAITSSSVAFNAASATHDEPTDQRGITRPQGTSPDMGSFELVVLPSVNATPDGAQSLLHLPSGPNYSFTFTVTNGTGAGAQSFDLLASKTGTAVAIVSVNGVAGDSTRITGLAAGSSQSIAVVYTIGNVAAGVLDTLRLLARSVTAPAVTDPAFADLEVVRPNIAIVKAVAPPGTPLPGADLTYSITLTNAGTEAAVSVVHVDSLPAQVGFKVGSLATTLPAGVSATGAYSNDGAASWTYVPASAACGAPAGYDYCVTHIRLSLDDPLGHAAPDNVVDLEFVARVR